MRLSKQTNGISWRSQTHALKDTCFMTKMILQKKKEERLVFAIVLGPMVIYIEEKSLFLTQYHTQKSISIKL